MNGRAGFWLGLVHLVVQTILVIVAGTWVIASVERTTAVLGNQIGTLSSSIIELRTTITTQAEQIQQNRSGIAELRQWQLDHKDR